MKCSVRSNRIIIMCSFAKQKQRQQRSAFIVKFAAFIELMSVVVRSWQPMIEALSKRLCIMTRDRTDLQHFFNWK